MLIQHRKRDTKGLFFIEEDGDVVAEMVYTSPQSGIMIIKHTEVDREIRGQDIGYELVHHAVQYARQHGIKIVPVCPFVKAVMDRKPDFQDVLFQE